MGHYTVSGTVKDIITQITKSTGVTGTEIDSSEACTQMLKSRISYQKNMVARQKFSEISRNVITAALASLLQLPNIQKAGDNLNSLLNQPIVGGVKASVSDKSFLTPEAVRITNDIRSKVTSIGTHFICDNNGKTADIIFILLQNGYLQAPSNEVQQALSECLSYEAVLSCVGWPKRNQEMDESDTYLVNNAEKYYKNLKTVIDGLRFVAAENRANLRPIVNLGDFFDDLVDAWMGDRSNSELKLRLTELKTSFLSKMNAEKIVNTTPYVQNGMITLIRGNHENKQRIIMDENQEVIRARNQIVNTTMRHYCIDNRDKLLEFFISHIPPTIEGELLIINGSLDRNSQSLRIDLNTFNNREEIWKELDKQFANGGGYFDSDIDGQTFPRHSEIQDTVNAISSGDSALSYQKNSHKTLVFAHGHYSTHADGLVEHGEEFVTPQGYHMGGVKNTEKCARLNLNSYSATLGDSKLGGCILNPAKKITDSAEKIIRA